MPVIIIIKKEGHYSIIIVSDAFTGLPTIERHRLIHHALNTLMNHFIYALSIKAKTLVEYNLRAHG